MAKKKKKKTTTTTKSTKAAKKNCPACGADLWGADASGELCEHVLAALEGTDKELAFEFNDKEYEKAVGKALGSAVGKDGDVGKALAAKTLTQTLDIFAKACTAKSAFLLTMKAVGPVFAHQPSGMCAAVIDFARGRDGLDVDDDLGDVKIIRPPLDDSPWG